MKQSFVKLLVIGVLCVLVATLSLSVVMAKPDDKDVGKIKDELICPNEGFKCECQNFYDSLDYYAVEKWAPDGREGYKLDEENPVYSYYKIDVKGDLHDANWTSKPGVYAVLVKAGNNLNEFDGGSEGEVNSTKEISHITFCAHRSTPPGDNPPNGVPEFPPLGALVAVTAATGGIIFLRKH